MNKQVWEVVSTIIMVIIFLLFLLLIPVKAEELPNNVMSNVTNDEEQTNNIAQITEEELTILCQVATAEAGYYSAEAQKNVVWVILNRVNDERFKTSIMDVLHTPGQFGCIQTGAYKKMDITDFTKENVRMACAEYIPNESAQGALYFCKGNMNKKFLFKDEVKHNFFK